MVGINSIVFAIKQKRKSAGKTNFMKSNQIKLELTENETINDMIPRVLPDFVSIATK